MLINKYVAGVQYTTLTKEKDITKYLETVKTTKYFKKEDKDLLKKIMEDTKNVKEVKVGINFRDNYSETVVHYNDESKVLKTNYKETYDYLVETKHIHA